MMTVCRKCVYYLLFLSYKLVIVLQVALGGWNKHLLWWVHGHSIWRRCWHAWVTTTHQIFTGSCLYSVNSFSDWYFLVGWMYQWIYCCSDGSFCFMYILFCCCTASVNLYQKMTCMTNGGQCDVTELLLDCLLLVFTARCYAERGYATVCRPSLCLWRYVSHIGWNTSKIMLRLISLRFWLELTPTPVI